jgi:hypothetical protein
MADPRMVDRYLQSRGAAPSAQNANPDLLDRRAMGLPGGLDDNSGVLDAMLDKLMADTGAAPPNAAPVNASMPEAGSTAGDARPAPAPSKRGPVASPNPGASRQAGYGPATDTRNRQMNYGPAAKPVPSGMVNEQGMPVEYAGEANVTPPEDGGILKWLLPILGISAAVPAAENMRGRMPADPALPPPNPRISGPQTPAPPGSPLALEDQDYGRVQGRRVTEYPSGAPVITDHTMRNVQGTAEMYSDAPYARQGQKNQVRAEVDAENDAMMRQMEEQERARRGQKRTKELTDAAKRAVGRR